MIEISQRFSDEVALHLIANYRTDVRSGTPLLLGIQGPPGEGKTYQVEQLLDNAGIRLILVSGGELESPNAGAPAAKIRAAYVEAAEYIANKMPAVIVLNDADAAIGSWGDLTQYTVNTQNLVTELMHLADYPTLVEGKHTRRVPIILTGNDFTRLYAPLRRNGRMRIFSWRMATTERASAIQSLFAGISPEQADDLAVQFPDQPIAFWAAVRNQIDETALITTLRRHGLPVLAKELVAGSTIQLSRSPHSVPEITALAKAIAGETVHDFLSPPGSGH